MMNVTGSTPRILSMRPRSAKGGAALGCGGVKIYEPFGTYTRKSTQIKYVVQDTSCNCGKKSFLEKFLESASLGVTALVTGMSIVDIFSQIFGKKKTDATEPKTPVEPQPPTGAKEPAVNNNKTYYGGMLREVTVTGKLNNTADAATITDDTTDDSTGDISQTAAELTKQYAAICNIEITGEEGSYQAKITYKDADGKTVSKDVDVTNTDELNKKVADLLKELQTLDNDVGKAAQQIKQMYAGIISDIEVTQNDNGTYNAKITVPNTLKKAGDTAVKTVTVSSSEELDKAVSDFTTELLTTEENNLFKAATAFENDLKSSEGADISAETIDQLVQSQVDLYNAYGDGEGDISLQDMFAYEKATADKSQNYQEIQTASKMFFMAYDADNDHQVTAGELKEFYNAADTDKNGKLTTYELQSHVRATLEEKKGLDFNELASVRYGGNTEGPTQDKADSLVEMIKGNFYGGPTKVRDKFVDYKDGQFRIADNWDMENCKTISEEEVKKLYMGS